MLVISVVGATPAALVLMPRCSNSAFWYSADRLFILVGAVILVGGENLCSDLGGVRSPMLAGEARLEVRLEVRLEAREVVGVV